MKKCGTVQHQANAQNEIEEIGERDEADNIFEEEHFMAM